MTDESDYPDIDSLLGGEAFDSLIDAWADNDSEDERLAMSTALFTEALRRHGEIVPETPMQEDQEIEETGAQGMFRMVVEEMARRYSRTQGEEYYYNKQTLQAFALLEGLGEAWFHAIDESLTEASLVGPDISDPFVQDLLESVNDYEDDQAFARERVQQAMTRILEALGTSFDSIDVGDIIEVALTMHFGRFLDQGTISEGTAFYESAARGDIRYEAHQLGLTLPPT